MKKKRYPTRQVRRAAERRKEKRTAQKEQAQKGNQVRSNTQESDKPKRKIDWKLASGIIGAIGGIIGTIVKVAEFIRDTFTQ